MPSAGRLADYRRKRDFAQTPEPPPARATTSRARPGFVVQLHHAKHRHFDFRLEVDGTLRSWAVPKGPSRDPAARRLAVQVEDHPLDYGRFEGVIPAGHYGAGRVAIWDRGHWESEDDPAQALREGRLAFELHGQRLRGRWTLVRIRTVSRSPQWLLIKASDPWVRDGDLADDRPLAEAVQDMSAKPVKRRHRGAVLPGVEALQLALSAQRPPERGRWMHEVKYDGYRLCLRRHQGNIALLSRNGLDWTARLPQIAAALRTLPCGAVLLDGELVALNPQGRSDFDALQAAMADGGDTSSLRVFAFDLLWLDSADLRGQPLQTRRLRLESLLGPSRQNAILISPGVEGDSAALRSAACAQGLEGLVAKDLDAAYCAGRSGHWLKLKCVAADEFVIVAYTRGKASRAALGALLLARPEGRSWRYVGRVGSGLSESLIGQLQRCLRPRQKALELLSPPATADLRAGRPQWVVPTTVVEVEHRGMTREGRLRQASVKALRPDKGVRDLRLAPDAQAHQPNVAGHDAPVRKQLPALTHPERRVFQDPPVTKQQLADYYAAVAAPMLRELRRRPISVLRCPEGITGECFFQRHLSAGFSDAVREHQTPRSGRKQETVLYIEDGAGLQALVQMGVVEIHAWGALVDDLHSPDRLVFDLDPGAGVAWPRVIAAARLIREHMQAAGLTSFVRTTGGKGLHVVVPLQPAAGWDTVKAFAKATALLLAANRPGEFVAVAGESRRRGRIFIDYLRNSRSASSVASYSVRARSGAGVAMPLAWEDLSRLRSASTYHIGNARRRIAARPDPWAEFESQRRPLPNLESR